MKNNPVCNSPPIIYFAEYKNACIHFVSIGSTLSAHDVISVLGRTYYTHNYSSFSFDKYTKYFRIDTDGPYS